jgi:hypothetical protein
MVFVLSACGDEKRLKEQDNSNMPASMNLIVFLCIISPVFMHQD